MQGADTRQCPHCAEEIKAAATFCKHCHRSTRSTAALLVPWIAALALVLVVAGLVALQRTHQAPSTEPAALHSAPTSAAPSPPLAAVAAINQTSPAPTPIMQEKASAPTTAENPPPASAAVPPAAPVIDPSAFEYSHSGDVIRNFCMQQWTSDFNMQAYCVDQQQKAVAALQGGRPADISEASFEQIRSACASQWPNDFNMREYCEQQQFTGYRKVK
jgi:hypothetical protein